MNVNIDSEIIFFRQLFNTKCHRNRLSSLGDRTCWNDLHIGRSFYPLHPLPTTCDRSGLLDGVCIFAFKRMELLYTAEMARHFTTRRFIGISTWINEISFKKPSSRYQRPRGLRHVLSSAAQTLGSQVRILLGAWMCVCVSLCCVVLCR
jgi:hypothetical protein